MIPLIAMAAKKVGTMVAKKGAQKVAQKGAQKVAQKGAQKVAQKGVQKGAEKAAQKGMGKFDSFDKFQGGKKDEGDSKYEHTGAPPKFHKGGTVRKSGLAELKKGEVVLTEKQAHKLKRVGGKSSTKKVSTHKKLSKKRVSLKRS